MFKLTAAFRRISLLPVGLLAALLFFSALGGAAQAPAAAQAVSPAERLALYEAQFHSATSDVDRLAAVYRIQELNQWLTPQVMSASLLKLAATAGTSPLLAAEIQAALATEDLRLGDAEAATKIWQQLGVLEAWQAVGPFDNSSPAQIASPASASGSPEQAIDLAARYQGKQRSVGWRTLPYSSAAGMADLSAYFTPNQSVSAYLVTWVRANDAQNAALRLREDGSTRVWVNGQLVFDEQAAHSSGGFDQHAAAIHLVAGWNEILAKVGNSESGNWRFAARLTTPEGAPLAFEAEAIPHARPAAAAAAAAAANAPAPADLTAQAKAAAANGGMAEWQYALILAHKHSFNAGDHDDVNAYQAVLAAPNGLDARAVRLDFVQHDTDVSRRYRNLEQLLAGAPASDAVTIEAHAERGSIELERSELWPARDDFDAALVEASGGAYPAPASGSISALPTATLAARVPEAALGEMGCYAGLAVRALTLDWADLLRQAGLQSSERVAAGVAAQLRRVSLDGDALAWFKSAHDADVGNLQSTLALADALRRQNQDQAVMPLLQQAVAIAGDLPALRVLEARTLAGLGREAEALATVQSAVRLDPDDPTLLVAQGELQSRFGHADTAQRSWQDALNLNPQDSNLRDRVQQVRGTQADESFERAYVVDLQQAMADYAKKASPAIESGPLVIVADTTVINIFASGNPGRYVQQIFRINNTNGADALSTYGVTYDPAEESVRYLVARVVHGDGSTADAAEAEDEPVSESVGYETFYDVRNKYVRMPPMRAGDFVEIAYRVLPNSLESLYGDYFGDLAQFGSSAPTLFQQYVALTPANKSLYYKEVRFGGAAHPGQKAEVKEVAGQKIYRWSASDLPAQVDEPDAPPAVELMPYVEVSSFADWDQFAHWYTQLIRDTFVTDDELRQTVAGLINGKTTVDAKVEAIYRYVIQNTHYVALEFGIHGYRPYPVTQVFHRRFGDCKDKASLLIAMLNLAGVPADFVLVRTRDRGVLDPGIPTVADFDHAIVYVPALKRYLDGTSEFSGAAELPGGDQRAFVLRVPVLSAAQAAASAGPVHEAPEVTPDLPAKDSVTTRLLTGQLNPAGDLSFSLHWEIVGGRAPEFRAAMQLADRQAGALQAMLHDRLPGITISNVSVQHENDWDQPLIIDCQGAIPRFATVNGNLMLVPRQFLPTAWLPRMASLPQRRSDVLSDPPEELNERMVLTLPDGFGAALPPDVNLTGAFASFAAQAKMEGNQLTLTSNLAILQSLITPGEYQPYRQFWSSVDASLNRQIEARQAAAGIQ